LSELFCAGEQAPCNNPPARWQPHHAQVNISTAVTGNGLTKPTLSATYENVFEF